MGHHIFQSVLLGKKFRVKMDNNPLIYFAMSLNLDAMKYQWIDELAPYDFPVEYQKAKLNFIADMLSRMTGRFSEQEADSYLQTVEDSTSIDTRADNLNGPPSQDESEFESPWSPPGLNG